MVLCLGFFLLPSLLQLLGLVFFLFSHGEIIFAKNRGAAFLKQVDLHWKLLLKVNQILESKKRKIIYVLTFWGGFGVFLFGLVLGDFFCMCVLFLFFYLYVFFFYLCVFCYVLSFCCVGFFLIIKNNTLKYFTLAFATNAQHKSLSGNSGFIDA